jgi:protocatechuate 3,4-dioxygenase beta subunit
MSQNKMSRRQILKWGGVAAGGLVAGQALGATTCEAPTAEQPLGPFFPREGTPVVDTREDKTKPNALANDNDLTFLRGNTGVAEGQVVFVKGQVLDRNCEPIVGARVVIWQASRSGLYNHQGDQQNIDFIHPETGLRVRRKHDGSFQYWGRTLTDDNGEYLFKTIVPGFYPAQVNDPNDPGQNWYRPPHIHFLVSATGHPQLVTQLYFRGEQLEDNDFIQRLNARDFLLRDQRISLEDQENLIVDFKPSQDPRFGEDLVGQFDIKL